MVAVLQVAAMEVVVEETLADIVQVVEEVVAIDQVEEILEEAEVMEGEVRAVFSAPSSYLKMPFQPVYRSHET